MVSKSQHAVAETSHFLTIAARDRAVINTVAAGVGLADSRTEPDETIVAQDQFDTAGKGVEVSFPALYQGGRDLYTTKLMWMREREKEKEKKKKKKEEATLLFTY